MNKRQLLTGHQKDILEPVPDKFPKRPMQKVKEHKAYTGQVLAKNRTRSGHKTDKIAKSPLKKEKIF